MDFTVKRMGSGTPVVLVVGGIQGDEPGGFSAASLLATHYRILDGTVIVVPNLNFHSIIRRSRGLHGDMNRKFAALQKSDPEYDLVRRIQDIIAQPEIDIVLNLHDGSGFYRPVRETPQRSPDRWGQCLIVDQSHLPGTAFPKLEELAQEVAHGVNQNLLKADHNFFVKNTHTASGNVEMEKTLTWFAINNNKPAFGLEVSKDFGVGERVFYHLSMLEHFFREVGLDFERSFPLSPSGIVQTLGSNVWLSLADSRVVLPMQDVRLRQAGEIPVPRNNPVISSPIPILAFVAEDNICTVHYGNNTLTSFKPHWVDLDTNLNSWQVEVDGVVHTVRPGDVVQARENIKIASLPGYRSNAIGVTKGRDESGILLHRSDFLAQYSVDQAGSTFRVEGYAEEKFGGMFLVRFGDANMAQTVSPYSAGYESSLGW